MSKTQLQTNNTKYSQLIELLRSKAVGEGSLNIDDITHTVWQFNEVLNDIGTNAIYYVGFYYLTSDGDKVNCDSLEFDAETNYFNVYYNTNEDGMLNKVPVYSGGAWINIEYQKIYFTSNTENAEFLSWLVENATLVGGVSGESSTTEWIQTATPSGFLSSTATGTVYYSLPTNNSALLGVAYNGLQYFSYTKTYRTPLMDPMPIGTLFVVITTGTVTLPNISGGVFNLRASGTGYYIYSIDSV